MADGRAHAPHLPVLSLGQDDLEPGGSVPPGPQEADPGASGLRPVGEDQPRTQGAQGRLLGNARHPGVVGLGHLVLRIGEAMAQAMVVREDEQAGGVAVEAADREDPASHVAEGGVDGGAAPGIDPGRQKAGRLVEGEDDPLGLVAHRAAVHRDPVASGVDPAVGGELDHSRHPDPPGRDPPDGLLPRADAELGEGPGEGDPARGGRGAAQAPGASPRANVIWPSHTTFPSTRATPRRLPILLRRRTTVPSSITWSPATTGRR